MLVDDELRALLGASEAAAHLLTCWMSALGWVAGGWGGWRGAARGARSAGAEGQAGAAAGCEALRRHGPWRPRPFLIQHHLHGQATQTGTEISLATCF